MKVTDERIDWLIRDCCWKIQGETFTKKDEEIRDSLIELQSLRKIDIEYTLKYAEEAGAAIEELKQGVEEAIKEIEHYRGITKDGVHRGYGNSLDIIKKHVSKHLE